MLYAGGAVVALTAINILSVREGKWTQNVLTSLKILGLVIVAVAAFLPVAAAAGLPAAASNATPERDYSTALIVVLFIYGGWNEMAYVAAEVRRPEKNLLRALMLGTAAVTMIYVLLNVAFVHALGFAGTQASKIIAADVVTRVVPAWGGKAIAALICISALSAVNGMIFTGSRITYAMGTEHPLWACSGPMECPSGTPVWSLLVQAVITLVLVVGLAVQKTPSNAWFSLRCRWPGCSSRWWACRSSYCEFAIRRRTGRTASRAIHSLLCSSACRVFTWSIRV